MKNKNSINVSIIVPVYMVEDTLDFCLDSLTKQSMQDIEIILVDDASIDRSSKICEEYAVKDKRFKVIHHLVNKGLSESRNTGIQNALGDYLMFVDSDDWVHNDFCKLPFECATRYQADVVMFRHQRINNRQTFNKKKVDKEKPISENNNSTVKSGCKSTRAALDLLFSDIKDYAWNKLYKKEMFKDISFPSGFYYEDIGTTYKLILRASCIYYLNEVLYYHALRTNSLSTHKTKKAMQDMLAMTIQRHYDLIKWGYPPENLDILLQKMAFLYCVRMKRDLSDQNRRLCEQIIQMKTIPKNINVKLKFMFMILKRSPVLFELVCNLLGCKYYD